jgi:preprotein translocase subunit YajC
MNRLFYPLVAMAAPAQPGRSPQSPLAMFVPLALMIAIFYFLLIRPQQRREKERRALLESVKVGDRVLFGGGLLGIVTGIKDKTFTIKIADNVRVEVVRSAVTQVIPKGEAPEAVDSK